MQKKAWRGALTGGLVIFFFLVCTQAYAAKWELYDNFNFNSGGLDISKWSGYETSGNLSPEGMRIVSGKALHLATYGHGFVSPTPQSLAGGQRLALIKENEDITAIQAKITVKDHSVIGDDTCSGDQRVRARIVGIFFNTGSSTPGNSTGDVFVQIYLARKASFGDEEGKLNVVADVSHCGDNVCMDSTSLFNKELGTVNKGQPVWLSLMWDEKNHKFAFSMDKKDKKDKKSKATASFSYKPSELPNNSLPGTFYTRRLETVYNVYPCPEEPAPEAFIHAIFDDVKVLR